MRTIATCYCQSLIVLFCVACLTCSGCELLYRVLHKEGAQEKKLLGDATYSQHNPVVEEIQNLLTLFGYHPGKADGKLGTKTRNAIEHFQKERGLPATRFVDNKTWRALQRFSTAGLVRNGEIDIEVVQVALYNAGFDPGIVDGKFGPHTLQKIREFQSAHNLKPDGKVGYQTLCQLQKYLSN